jgi:alpha-glucoside transport system substrate-binding protein
MAGSPTRSPFDDPRIVDAIETFGMFARNDDYVAGGAGRRLDRFPRFAQGALCIVPPQCYMHRQASFIPSFFPEGTVVGEDVDFFYFPAFAEKDLGRPVLGGGHALGDDHPFRMPRGSSWTGCRPRSRMRSGWRRRAS